MILFLCICYFCLTWLTFQYIPVSCCCFSNALSGIKCDAYYLFTKFGMPEHENDSLFCVLIIRPSFILIFWCLFDGKIISFWFLRATFSISIWDLYHDIFLFSPQCCRRIFLLLQLKSCHVFVRTLCHLFLALIVPSTWTLWFHFQFCSYPYWASLDYSNEVAFYLILSSAF